MAAEEASRLWRNVRGLQEQSAASGVGHGGTRRSSRQRRWRLARRAERWLKRSGESFPRWKGLASESQATAFPFSAAESETNKRLPLLRGQFPATAFSLVAAKIRAERRLPCWRVNV